MRLATTFHLRAVTVVLHLWAGLHLGCHGRDPTPAAKPPVALAPTASSEAPGQAAQLVTKPSATGPAEATALVDHWIAAQNTGDFTAYDALYARRFEGVKRIGARSQSFDRDGWMRDRKRMFSKPMHVEAFNVAVNVFRQMAFVRFEQRWSSGTFADVGTKDIQLVREAGELRISVERMAN